MIQTKRWIQGFCSEFRVLGTQKKGVATTTYKRESGLDWACYKVGYCFSMCGSFLERFTLVVQYFVCYAFTEVLVWGGFEVDC